MKRLAGIVVVALALAGCGGDDANNSTATTPPPGAGPPPTPGSAAQFPPAFLKCMAARGVDVSNSSAIHAPGAQAAFQACLPYLHGG